MTKIIGHRGAKGLALENTLESFRLAKKLGVDRLEFDVRRTRDGQFVVCHDDHLIRVAGSWASIKHLTYAQLQAIPLRNGERVPLLRDVLELAGTTPVIVEIKVTGYTEEICEIIDAFPKLDVWYASFKHDVIAECRRLRPHIPVYVCEHFAPFSIVRTAHALHASGICLNVWLLNPLTYCLARRAKLQLYVYSVNYSWLARFLLRLYPAIDICTNVPPRVHNVVARRAEKK